MKRVLALSAIGISLAFAAAPADSPPLADILQKVSERYKSLQTYQIQADVDITMSRLAATGSTQNKITLAVGKDGMFRVEQDNNGDPEIRVSDGKITWKALPKKKVWARQEGAQMLDVNATEDEPGDQAMAQDLFTQTQRSLVARYTGLARYAPVAALDKNEKLKFNGGKVECYVIRIPGKASASRLYIDHDSFFVVRHVEVSAPNNGAQIQITTNYKQIREGAPDAGVFEYQPESGSREVADVSLPSERNVSLVGQRAGDFTLKTVDGTPVHLADLKGKVVLLDFWASWCPPCRHELPTIEALSRKYKDRNVLVYGINDEELKTAQHFLEKNHPDLETLHDNGGKVHRLYGCYSIPTVVVIDPSGTIVAHFVGERSEHDLTAALKQAGAN